LININKLRGKIAEKGLNISKLAELIGVDKSSMYRKIKLGGETLTIKEVELIVKALDLSTDEFEQIFFNLNVA